MNNNTVFAFDTERERPNTLLAVPKKGRLFERCLKLLEGSGLDYNRVSFY